MVPPYLARVEAVKIKGVPHYRWTLNDQEYTSETYPLMHERCSDPYTRTLLTIRHRVYERLLMLLNRDVGLLISELEAAAREVRTLLNMQKSTNKRAHCRWLAAEIDTAVAGIRVVEIGAADDRLPDETGLEIEGFIKEIEWLPRPLASSKRAG